MSLVSMMLTALLLVFPCAAFFWKIMSAPKNGTPREVLLLATGSILLVLLS